jgi:hypothetical protein
MTAPPPNLASVPCGADPAVRALMEAALPCRCGSTMLLPVSDCDNPPVFAVACEHCGDIEGDAPELAAAVANWNAIQRVQ